MATKILSRAFPLDIANIIVKYNTSMNLMNLVIDEIKNISTHHNSYCQTGYIQVGNRKRSEFFLKNNGVEEVLTVYSYNGIIHKIYHLHIGVKIHTF